MEEDLNENELEERFYSMLHYVDDTQTNVTDNQDGLAIVENAPKSTVRRYWRTSGDLPPANNTIYQKTNTHKEIPNNIVSTPKTKPKEEKREVVEAKLPAIFFSMPPDNVKNTIEIIEHDVFAPVLEIESSDEDEVIEVALPPKPTITIESSDEETVVVPKKSPQKSKTKSTEPSGNDREVSASPVPSIVSSVSDEFIRGDCIALNISSRHPDQHSFDFGLHGSEFLAQSTPSKNKKKRKRGKESTPTVESSTPAKPPNNEECFATPKSKAKNKKQKTKSYSVTQKTIPNVDVYDSDSNQSGIDGKQQNNNRVLNPYAVTEKSLPSFDVYESDSNQSDILRDAHKSKTPNIDLNSSDSLKKKPENVTNNKKNSVSVSETTIVDLTDNSLYNDSGIQENIIIGNVTGFKESEDYGEDHNTSVNTEKIFGSTKVPAILNENLDFDNLKGKEKVCKNRRYSLSTLRMEMEKFYNESWGGEDFNHREIQKYMSRDKSLWAIDPKDKMPTMHKKKPTCNYCHRVGHRDDTCRQKPSVCYMCGNPGHVEPRCPRKICVNCGSPNNMYSTMCRNCWGWSRVTCGECGQPGHPASHCPDLWRRYHNTVNFTDSLEENRMTKKHQQQFCSGCTRRGHLVHSCRLSLPFSGLPINSPYVQVYNPIYCNNQPRKPEDSPVVHPKNKRQSKSPTTHENHANKKRHLSDSDAKPKPNNSPFRKRSQSKDQPDDADKNKVTDKNTSNTDNTAPTQGKAPDFIPIGSSNHDKKGQMIQDNEVSDTSDIVTSARIYITNDIIDKLKTKEGQDWLKDTEVKYNVTVENTDITSFLSIKGNVGAQESFQSALRDWFNVKPNRERSKSENDADETQSEGEQSFASNNIPKNRNNVLRKISKALDSLKEDLGDPNSLFRELKFLQNRHQQLLKQKVINPKQVSNNRNHMNKMITKLNMVLIGQAGLADGSQHLNELYSLQEKLISFRQKNIPIDLRKEIGEHYHCIFTATPRDDYLELVRSYYRKNDIVMFRKLKKKKPLVLSAKARTFSTIQPQQQQNRPASEGKVDNVATNQKTQNRRPHVEKTKSNLVSFHKRLLNTKPNDSKLKKTRMELVRKLHSFIASLDSSSHRVRNDKMTSKTLKKMKKVQERAQVFLNTV